MTYIIAEPCIDIKDLSCVDVCPVDCIHEFGRILIIDPEECIDCGACEPECPVEAIFPDDALPQKWEPFVKINYAFGEGADVINKLTDEYATEHNVQNPPLEARQMLMLRPWATRATARAGNGAADLADGRLSLHGNRRSHRAGDRARVRRRVSRDRSGRLASAQSVILGAAVSVREPPTFDQLGFDSVGGAENVAPGRDVRLVRKEVDQVVAGSEPALVVAEEPKCDINAACRRREAIQPTKKYCHNGGMAFAHHHGVGLPEGP